MALAAGSESAVTGRASFVSTASFPIALGLAGVGACLRLAAGVTHLSPLALPGVALLVAAFVVLCASACFYLFKLLRELAQARSEFGDPTSANLLAPAFMAAMVLGSQLAPMHAVGAWFWNLAAAGHLLLLLSFAGRWVTHGYDSQSLNPTWFLPAAGIMTASMTAPAMGAEHFVLLLFGTGLTAWLILLPVVFRRVVFEPALAPKLRPTLFILAAPFGLAANSVLSLDASGGLLIAKTLAFGGTFLLVALLMRVGFFRRSGITLSWWATTFPIAALATAWLRCYGLDPAWELLALGLVLLVLALGGTLVAMIATVRVAWSARAGAVAAAADEVAALHCDAPAAAAPEGRNREHLQG